MLDIYRIRTRIEELNNRLIILNKDFKHLSEEELIGNVNLNAAAERHIQIAIQACIDIASHIISSLSLKRPSQKTSEVFEILAKEEIIDENLAKRLVKSTGYRNVVVHDYLDVDRHKTYDNIQNHLQDLSKFAQYIEKFLEKKKTKSN